MVVMVQYILSLRIFVQHYLSTLPQGFKDVDLGNSPWLVGHY